MNKQNCLRSLFRIQNEIVYLQFVLNFSLQSMCERSRSFYILRAVTYFSPHFILVFLTGTFSSIRDLVL